jgi:hypothetical protein
MHPSSSSRAFEKRPRTHDLKHPHSMDLISTNKTNKLLCFIDRFQNQRTMDFGFFGKYKIKSELKDYANQ